MSFVLCNLHMNNLSNDIASTIKQLVDDVLLSVITLNAVASLPYIKTNQGLTEINRAN